MLGFGFFFGGGGGWFVAGSFQEQEIWDIFPFSSIDPHSSEGISKNFIWVRKSRGGEMADFSFGNDWGPE